MRSIHVIMLMCTVTLLVDNFAISLLCYLSILMLLLSRSILFEGIFVITYRARELWNLDRLLGRLANFMAIIRNRKRSITIYHSYCLFFSIALLLFFATYPISFFFIVFFFFYFYINLPFLLTIFVFVTESLYIDYILYTWVLVINISDDNIYKNE
jgi:hypothetical protein